MFVLFFYNNEHTKNNTNAKYVMPHQYGITVLLKKYNTSTVMVWCLPGLQVGKSRVKYSIYRFTWGQCSTERHEKVPTWPVTTETETVQHQVTKHTCRTLHTCTQHQVAKHICRTLYIHSNSPQRVKSHKLVAIFWISTEVNDRRFSGWRRFTVQS